MNRNSLLSLMPPIQPALGIAFLNFIFLTIMLIVFFSFFANPSGFEIKMPSANEANGIEDVRIIVRITGENVLYLNDKVVTINDLKRAFAKTDQRHTFVYLRVDRRASMGRLADVWDVCKGLQGGKVQIIAY